MMAKERAESKKIRLLLSYILPSLIVFCTTCILISEQAVQTTGQDITHRKGELNKTYNKLTSTYYVEATNGSQCPTNISTEFCHSLDFYVVHSDSCFRNNVTFKFMSGIHILGREVVVDNVQNLSMTGTGQSSQILCNSTSAGFLLTNMTGLHFENLQIHKCGIHREEFIPLAGSLIIKDSLHLSLNNTTVTNSTGYGLLSINNLGHTIIRNCLFTHNAAGYSWDGGNVKIVFSAFLDPHTEYFVNIHNSQFIHGRQIHHQLLSTGCGGLTIDVRCFNVRVQIEDSLFSENTGFFGANLYFYFLMLTNNSVLIKNTTSSYGNTIGRGGGLFVMLSDSIALNDPYSCGLQSTERTEKSLLHIFDVRLIGNIGIGALTIEDRTYPEIECTKQYVLIQNCKFNENRTPLSWLTATAAVQFGYIPSAYDHIYNSFKLVYATFNNCTFLYNTALTNRNDAMATTLYFQFVENVTFVNCSIGKNSVSGIQALMSNLYFEGNNSIFGNTASYGAGISLLQNSYMHLKPDTQINFYNNHATLVGGALFSDFDLQTPSYGPCFFQVEASGDHVNNKILNSIRIDFKNNTAGKAGSAIFGGKTNCFPYRHRLSGPPVYNKIFNISNTKSDPSAATSDPFSACFCFNGSKLPNCSRKKYNVLVYPGANFKVPIATVGGYPDGTVPGVVQSGFATKSNASFGPLQMAQNSDHIFCTELNYTIYSSKTFEQFYVTAEKASFIPNDWQNSNHVTVTVTFLECPPAFKLAHNTGKCDCEAQLQINGVQCFIDNQTVSPPLGAWIGFYNHSNASGVLFHPHCPYGYCKRDKNFVSINNTDMQCTQSRSGILCGHCKPALSLTLGRNMCSQCTNNNLSLVLAFAAAGVALVVVLFVLRLTVTEGSINGLIFYANVVRMNQDILFPVQTTNILTVFIAWLNLDLGIDSCFFHGMDGFAKTFLQFVFPIYIWILVALVIFLANRFDFVANLVGQRAVQVLATLLLLSYTKLQRVIITVLTFTTIKYPDGLEKYVWLYDGNVQYLHEKHIPLFVASMVCLLVFILPYTILLTFFKFFLACSGHKPMYWVNRLKPVFDAYAGPYKDKLRFWTGFLLVVRTVLIFALAFNVLASPDHNLFIVAFTSLVLVATLGCSGGIYEKWTYNVLESMSYLNVGAVCLTLLYSKESQYAIINSSVGISFVVFLGVITYHLCKYTYVLKLITLVKRWRQSKGNKNEEEPLLFERDIDSSDDEDNNNNIRGAVVDNYTV